MLILIGFAMTIFALLAIEVQLKRGYKQNEKIIELLKELNQKR